jgi:NADH dehydrogenase FAD-containing subunit
MNKKEHFDKTVWCHNRKKTSYWLEGLPEFNDFTSLPSRKVDVAIVGSGYTGLECSAPNNKRRSLYCSFRIWSAWARL